MTGALGLLTRYGLSKAAGGPPPAATGLIANISNLGSTITSNLQVGWAFKPNQDLSAVGLRVRMTSGDSEVVRLWRVSDQALLATSDVLASNATTWADGAITPVTLLKDVEYIVASIRSTGGSRGWNLTQVSNVTWSGLATYVGARRTTSGSTAFPGTADGTNHAFGCVDVLAVPL